MKPADRRAAWCGAAVLAIASAGAAAQASHPHGQPDPGRETASAIADYNAGDYRAALVQFRDAAERGDRLAEFNYAMMMITGEGVTANVPEGLRWLRQAADAGMSHAQYVYGTMFDDGQFVARDPAQAHHWFLKAAQQGHVQAELALANQFLDGRGTPRDNRQAFVWYKQAADAGDPTAQYVTASFYERGGDGVTPNLNIARAYYAAAAAQGDEAAGLKFKELSAALRAPPAAGGSAARPQ
ncbi:sel1 repeat family protein [Burkholderia sp. FERM BP-3421]|uniref:tetratricopeptide repeat protein n=1 Tax=Burkholderia sp. FERM BP-3421 TaxID=1494466 RepID=UPI00235EE9D1|nr:tetratricopeptide repeat protein [Burkholderia sp. FERM BP-3421]WDD95705.1 sel1 repeat family protein [Burkholderia sp. FERM BP-3421]